MVLKRWEAVKSEEHQRKREQNAHLQRGMGPLGKENTVNVTTKQTSKIKIVNLKDMGNLLIIFFMINSHIKHLI